uniref:Oxidoreductase FAD/NAD(P)-binding domain-containing protein n=1 Tax=Anas platyrhynchos TaxID=8839 RepID=A0A8B9T0L0_ANAPL
MGEQTNPHLTTASFKVSCRYSPATAEGLFTHTHTLCFWHHDAGWWSARHSMHLWSTVEGLGAGSNIVGAVVWSDASQSVCLAGDVRVPLWVKKGGMKFPADPDTPVIMIGPGTGVAPFRAAIQERVAQGWKGSCLFFGCRQKSKDFYCQAEWEELVTKGFLTLFTAFSRDQEEKVYVQHRIQENRRLVWELLTSRSAHVYLAGNAKQMPAAVAEALQSVLQLEGGLSPSEAEKYLTALEQTQRFQSETWS